MRVHVIGGFLGAGKTTLVRETAVQLAAMGESVAIVTNDQGASLVDTQLCLGAGASVTEISGGCFCCRYDKLEDALRAAERGGATVALAEAVGSCTDLVATVLSPLMRLMPGLEVAPLTVVVDPLRVLEVESELMSGDVAYLFRKQIEEADVVLLSRADLDAPDVTSTVLTLNPRALILSVSAPTGTGIEEWLRAVPLGPSESMTLDYARYADAEALLGWANAVATVEHAAGLCPYDVLTAFLDELSREPVAHVKVATIDPLGGHASLVRQGDRPVLCAAMLPLRVQRLELMVNARVALPPEELIQRLEAAMRTACSGATVAWRSMESFRPSPPEPVHRDAVLCRTGDDGQCCASFYKNDVVRHLIGDSFHPGGIDFTLAISEGLGLGPDVRVLDVACGEGASLRALQGRWEVMPVGLDAGGGPNTSGLEIRRGDAHDVPFEDASFDAVLCECALSTFRDKPTALSEMARVLRPGGRLALTDMVVEGPLPEGLSTWGHLGTCIPGALRLAEYEALITDSGLRVIESRDAPEALRELLRRIKRNLVGLILAQAAGGVSGPEIDGKLARELLRQTDSAVGAGVLGYGVILAERSL